MRMTPFRLVVVAGFSLSVPAAADELPTEAFLVSPAAAHAVKDGYGNCVRTTAWSADKAILGCGKVVKPAPTAMAAPLPPATVAPSPPVIAPPPVPVAVVAAPPKPMMRTITLEADALFEFNSAFFKREGQPGDLEKFAQRVSGLASVEAVQVVGHSDSSGPSSYNQRLSEKRADSVKDFLVKSGVDPAKITIMGMGDRSPAADNATREGRAKNRRVVVMFKGVEEVK